jgi:hypothetical protein
MVGIGEEQKLVYDEDAEIGDGPFNYNDDDKQKYKHNTYVNLPADKVGMKNKKRQELLGKGYIDEKGELSKSDVVNVAVH